MKTEDSRSSSPHKSAFRLDCSIIHSSLTFSFSSRVFWYAVIESMGVIGMAVYVFSSFGLHFSHFMLPLRLFNIYFPTLIHFLGCCTHVSINLHSCLNYFPHCMLHLSFFEPAFIPIAIIRHYLNTSLTLLLSLDSRFMSSKHSSPKQEGDTKSKPAPSEFYHCLEERRAVFILQGGEMLL